MRMHTDALVLVVAAALVSVIALLAVVVNLRRRRLPPSDPHAGPADKALTPVQFPAVAPSGLGSVGVPASRSLLPHMAQSGAGRVCMGAVRRDRTRHASRTRRAACDGQPVGPRAVAWARRIARSAGALPARRRGFAGRDDAVVRPGGRIPADRGPLRSGWCQRSGMAGHSADRLYQAGRSLTVRTRGGTACPEPLLCPSAVTHTG